MQSFSRVKKRCSGLRLIKRTTLLALVSNLLILTTTINAQTDDHCGGDWSVGTTFINGGGCFDFQAGLVDDSWGAGSAVTDTCSYTAGTP